MKVELSLENLTEEGLAELCVARLEEAGLVVVPPVREEPYLVREAAEALSVSIDTIYREIAAKRLPVLPRLSVKRIPAWAIRIRQAGGDPMRMWRKLERTGEGFEKVSREGVA